MRALALVVVWTWFGGCVRAPPPPPPRAEPCGAAPGTVEVVEHQVHLTLTSLEAPQLSGEGTITLLAGASLDRAVLDAEGLTVQAASVNGRAVAFSTDDKHLCLDLPAPVRAGARLSVALRWTVPTTGPTPAFSASEVWAGYSTPRWLPTVFESSQRARLTLALTAPSALKVVASGVRGPPTVEGAVTTHHFALAQPTPPFLYGFAAGAFDETSLQVDGLTVRALGPRGVRMDAGMAATGRAYSLLRRWAGVDLPGEYTLVFVSGEAAQEAAGLAFFSSAALGALEATGDDWVFTHELAHQWFGVAVQCADFSDFWLNEGFATFLTARAKAELRGAAGALEERQRWLERSGRVHADGKDAPISLSAPWLPAHSPPDAHLQPRGVIYSRGALVLDRLRGELGDDVFWAGVRLYVTQGAHQPRGVRTEALRAALEQASGRPLSGFFKEWVYSPHFAFDE